MSPLEQLLRYLLVKYGAELIERALRRAFAEDPAVIGVSLRQQFIWDECGDPLSCDPNPRALQGDPGDCPCRRSE